MLRPPVKQQILIVCLLFAAAPLLAPAISAVDAADDKPAAKTVGPDIKALKESRQRGINFLGSTQGDDGSWTAPNAPGICGLVVTSLLQSGVPVNDPAVAKGLKHLESFIQKDGGVYAPKSNHRNYETCIAMLAFHSANADGRYEKTIAGTLRFLREQQWDQGEGLETSDPGFGGAGYGSHERPDLSNTQFLLDALKASGADANDPAVKKALIFVSRSQNLETEHNDTKFAPLVNDGGFFYTPAAGGSSQAGATENGGLRSYGSMTYAGLKSFIYAGLKSDDPRVKAAFQWVQRHYTLDENPGLGQQGLYYYFHTFAKALSVLDLDYLEDAQGNKHDWRGELAAKLVSLQNSNGSWLNKRADRWYEGDPNLATAYSLLALSYCDPKPAK